MTKNLSYYHGTLLLTSVYAVIDIPLVQKLRLFTGVRYEYADMDLFLWDPTKSEVAETDKEPVEHHNYMPAVNLTYSPIQEVNIRWSFSKTVARPDFREVSRFKYEMLGRGQYIQGNPDLKETDIYHADFRVEWFPSPTELIAASCFFKYLYDPIEITEVNYATGDELSMYKNAEYAYIAGAEIELRKNFGFMSSNDKVTKVLKGFSVALNVAYIYSRINVKDESSAKYTEHDRPLQGQSPWVVNTSLNYDNSDIGLSTSVLYNVKGPYITNVGISGVGDEYEEPFHRLDFVLKQRVFKNGQIKLTLKNLIDPEIKRSREITNSTTGVKKTFTTKSYREGRSIGIGYTQKI